ncbi:uncharacterized protein KY384_002651 [Bacidia gigantensis]|uniref:uncharacterized protein n=1 Tax=Bacidia gigantensis TaxID=2732470 RepID=UPI001D04B07E|nr:uncharacterized protein KY384_002651 [Bacidia gigantensis]KAG8532773.1 hypothetical protein KY384_002651 [Bacidia gigantensis]
MKSFTAKSIVARTRTFSQTTLNANKSGLRSSQPFNANLAEHLTPTIKTFLLQGKVALITGGARGLGWNMAQALAEAGTKEIALVDLKQELGQASAAELQDSTGIPVRFYAADVTDADAIKETVSQISKDSGSIDIVVNSAGIVDSNIKAETYPPSAFRRLLDINLTGSFIVSQACGQQMIASGNGGSIIFLSSIAGSRVLHPQQQCAYNASKAAVTQLAKSLAGEWAPHGIRVNTIAPGYMDTQLNEDPLLQAQRTHWEQATPMGRIGTPDELNGLAVFFSSDASRFVTGAHVYADGGYAVY